MISKQRLVDALPIILPFLALLPFLGNSPLFDVDEGAFSAATQEMLARGDYLSTWLNGSARFDKPILIYWLQALSVSLLGANEWGFRLPSALAAVGWCIVLARFAREHFGRDAALMTSLVVLTCLGVQLIGRAATADALLNLLLALAMVDLWRHIEGKSPWAARRLALWVALGFLTKGPIALLVPGATMLLWALFSRQTDALVRLLRSPANWLIFLAVALPWYIAAYAIHGDAFIQGFFMRHNVQRFSTTLEGHSGSLFYYVLIVPLLIFPWLPWLWQALRRLRNDIRQPLPRFLWLWCGFVVVFFSLSGTKLPHYALYGCTPLFVLLAARHADVSSRWAILPGLLLLTLFAALPSILGQTSVTDGFYAAQLSRLPELLTWHYGLFAGLLLLFALLTPMLAIASWQRAGMVALGSSLLLSAALAPLLGELLQGPIRNAGVFARTYQEPVIQSQTHWPSFSVYLGRPTPVRNAEPGELALTRTDRLPPAGDYDTLYAEGGVALIRIHATPVAQ